MARFAVARAIAMRALAAPVKLSGPSAYFAGLLCDVGAAFLLNLIAGKKNAPASPDECLAFAREHNASVGAQLLGKWGYAPDVVRCVREQGTRTTGSAEAALLALGTATASVMLDEAPPIGEPPTRQHADQCAKELGLAPAVREQRVKAAAAELKSMLAPRR